MEAVLGLDATSSAEQWCSVLKAFNEEHEGAWKLSEQYGQDRKRDAAALMKSYIISHQSDPEHAQAMSQVLCACRIFLRERVALEPLLNAEFLALLLPLCGSDDQQHLAAEVPVNALKSAINVLYNNGPMLNAFHQMQGPLALLEIVKRSKPIGVHWFAIRTINMLISASDSFCQFYLQLGILDVLVSELAFLIRCNNPPFPHGKDRFDCVKEIFKVLFALRNFLESQKQGDSINDDPVFAQLGALLVELLKMPNSNSQTYALKLEAIDLLIFMPREFGYVMLLNDCVPALMDILSYQLTSVVIESESDGSRSLAPVLIVCTNFVQSSPAAKHAVKRIVFPNAVPEPQPGEESKAGGLSRKNMAPRDAPRHTLRYYLIQLMTSLEAVTKRYATEFLYALCDDDDEFVARTGFGNAVAMLRLRGLLG